MQEVPLALFILLVLSRHSPPPPQPPLSLCGDETRKARRAEWERDAPLALSGLRKVLPPRPREGRLRGGGGPGPGCDARGHSALRPLS